MRDTHYSEALTLRIPPGLARRLDKVCQAEERTRSEYIRELLRSALRGGAVVDAVRGQAR